MWFVPYTAQSWLASKRLKFRGRLAIEKTKASLLNHTVAKESALFAQTNQMVHKYKCAVAMVAVWPDKLTVS